MKNPTMETNIVVVLQDIEYLKVFLISGQNRTEENAYLLL